MPMIGLLVSQAGNVSHYHLVAISVILVCLATHKIKQPTRTLRRLVIRLRRLVIRGATGP